MVSAVTVEDVFCVSGNDVASYVERDHVDDAFLATLHTDQKIVVCGARQSKAKLPWSRSISTTMTASYEFFSGRMVAPGNTCVCWARADEVLNHRDGWGTAMSFN